MKILLVVGSFPPQKDGVGDHVDMLAKALRQETKTPCAVLTSERTSSKTIEAVGWSLAKLPALTRQIKELGPDIVHIHYPSLGFGRQLGIVFLPWLLRKWLSVVLTLHEYEPRYSAFARFRLRTIAKLSSHVIASNSPTAELLEKDLQKPIEIIPIRNNLNISSRRREKVRDPNKVRLVFFGYVQPHKGVDEILQALLLDTGRELTIIGGFDEEDPYHQTLKRLIAKNNLEARVNWTGHLEEAEIDKVLGEADLAVLPFSHKGSTKHGTLTMLIGTGLPTISYVHETDGLAHQKTLWCLKRPSANHINEAIDYLLQDPELYKTLSSQGIEFGKKFTPPAIAKVHLELYSRSVDR